MAQREGRLALRTWARGITTAYSYFGEQEGEPDTGEMRRVDYSDADTPDLIFPYKRRIRLRRGLNAGNRLA